METNQLPIRIVSSWQPPSESCLPLYYTCNVKHGIYSYIPYIFLNIHRTDWNCYNIHLWLERFVGYFLYLIFQRSLFFYFSYTTKILLRVDKSSRHTRVCIRPQGGGSGWGGDNIGNISIDNKADWIEIIDLTLSPAPDSFWDSVDLVMKNPIMDSISLGYPRTLNKIPNYFIRTIYVEENCAWYNKAVNKLSCRPYVTRP
jgi:hypothetical protein